MHTDSYRWMQMNTDECRKTDEYRYIQLDTDRRQAYLGIDTGRHIQIQIQAQVQVDRLDQIRSDQIRSDQVGLDQVRFDLDQIDQQVDRYRFRFRQAQGQVDRWIDRDRWLDRQINKQINRQEDTHRYRWIQIQIGGRSGWIHVDKDRQVKIDQQKTSIKNGQQHMSNFTEKEKQREIKKANR